MADINLVIKIPEDTVNKIKDNAMFAGSIPSDILWDITRAIVNGKQDILSNIRTEIEQKIEQERFARSVFRGEEKDAVKAEQCTGSIFAYNNVIKLIDEYKAENEGR